MIWRVLIYPLSSSTFASLQMVIYDVLHVIALLTKGLPKSPRQMAHLQSTAIRMWTKSVPAWTNPVKLRNAGIPEVILKGDNA